MVASWLKCKSTNKKKYKLLYGGQSQANVKAMASVISMQSFLFSLYRVHLYAKQFWLEEIGI